MNLEKVQHYGRIDVHESVTDHRVEGILYKCLEPAPKKKVRLVEHHPWDKHGAENPDNSCADCSIRDDDGDQPCEEREYKLDSVGAKESVRLRK